MTSSDERTQPLIDAADSAIREANRLTESAWPDATTHERVDEVLIYARSVVGTTDGSLVPDSASNALLQTLNELSNTPEAVAGEAMAWIERLLDQLVRFPAARGRDLEQDVKQIAQTFQRSLKNRLSAIERAANSAAGELEQTQQHIDSMAQDLQGMVGARAQEFQQTIDGMQASFETRLQSYESNLETERAEGLKLRGEQAETFQAAQAERTEQARQSIHDLESELKQRADEAVLGLESSRERVAGLVDLVTRSTTSEGFAGEANRQRGEADVWRMVAVVIGGITAALGIAFVVLYSERIGTSTDAVITKAVAVLALGALAGYAAKQSAEHRHREVRARRLALELTAFGPFAQALNNVERELEVRTNFIDRIFVGERGLPDPSESTDAASLTSGDVSLLGQLIDVLRKVSK